MSLLNDVATRLIANNVVTAVGTDLFLTRNTKLPVGDGPYLSLVELPGSGPDYVHDGVYPNPKFQVVARAMRATDARTLAAAVHADLQTARNITIGSTFYLWILPEGEPFELPADDASRARYAFNVRVMLRRYNPPHKPAGWRHMPLVWHLASPFAARRKHKVWKRWSGNRANHWPPKSSSAHRTTMSVNCCVKPNTRKRCCWSTKV